MQITKEMLEEEISVLQQAAKLHAKYSISQYKQVLSILDELEEEKELLEKKVQLRTSHLEQEIVEKEQLANKLEKIAKYDQLTGLANRYLFLSELELIYNEAKLLDKCFSLFFLDLDGFKLINDTYGHEVGDLLLQIIAKRIRSIVRKDDMVSRLGGDEFTIIFRNLSEKEKLEELGSLLIQTIQEPVEIDDLTIYVGASIGIYTFEMKDNESFYDITARADIAMYESKKAGKGIYTFFDESMQEELYEMTNIKQKIKTSLQEQQFVNYFQPIVSSVDQSIKGAEVLLRWVNEGSLVQPNIFIPLLEDDIHLIKDVTFWQIEMVVDMLKETTIFFSVNLSAKLLNSDLIVKLNTLLNEKKFDPSRIHFEVTETSLSTNMLQTSQILSDIKEMGFHLSLDDFGTGYSSLAYLRELSFDTLKIDKKFIDDAFKSKKNKKLLFAIMQMARILEMKLVLEGIEESHQLEIFDQDEYIKFQGYLFYRPMDRQKLSETISFSPKTI